MANTKRAREQKREAIRRLGRKRRQQNVVITASIVGIGILLVGLVIYIAVRPKSGTFIPDLGNQHIQPPAQVTYNSTPPTSGPHYSSIAPWGIHETPIPNELQVHNLEDGGIMVQYSCPDECTDLIIQLTSVVERYDSEVILAPYPEMESPIALTAWNRLETLDEFDEARIIKFIKEYRGVDHHK